MVVFHQRALAFIHGNGHFFLVVLWHGLLFKAKKKKKKRQEFFKPLTLDVEKTFSLTAGVGVLRLISTAIVFPAVRMPNERGVTSYSDTRFFIGAPDSTAACTAAPYAIASSGFTPY